MRIEIKSAFRGRVPCCMDSPKRYTLKHRTGNIQRKMKVFKAHDDDDDDDGSSIIAPSEDGTSSSPSLLRLLKICACPPERRRRVQEPCLPDAPHACPAAFCVCEKMSAVVASQG